MSATKRGKQKQPAEVAEEEDFETFVRESLGQLSKGQKQIIQDISNLKAKVKLNETALDKISSQFKTLNDSFEELKGELHDARCKVDEMESSVQKHAKQIEGMRERLLSLERYSREYNLRFHNVPESTDEDCVQKVRNILSNQLDMEPEIENAHRVGLRNDDKPRVIICKFLYRPQRYNHGIFTLEELNQLSHVVKPQLSALHLNITSLSKHFDELCHLLNSFPFQLDLFACSETWITPQVDISSLQISGYNIITDNRTFSTGGGVALYLKSSFEYHLRNDLKIAGIENIWVDTQDSIIGVIYNSPSGSQRDFIDEFENVLRSVFLSKRKCLILGDSSTSIHSSRAQQQKKTST